MHIDYYSVYKYLYLQVPLDVTVLGLESPEPASLQGAACKAGGDA